MKLFGKNEPFRQEWTFSARMKLAVLQSFANFGLSWELWLSLLIILTPRHLFHVGIPNCSSSEWGIIKMNPGTTFDFSSIGGLLPPNWSRQPTLSYCCVFVDASIIVVSIIDYILKIIVLVVSIIWSQVPNNGYFHFHANPDNFHELIIQLVVMLKVLIGEYHHHHEKEVVSNEQLIHTYHLLTRPSSQHTS